MIYNYSDRILENTKRKEQLAKDDVETFFRELVVEVCMESYAPIRLVDDFISYIEETEKTSVVFGINVRAIMENNINLRALVQKYLDSMGKIIKREYGRGDDI